ncbi:hypothetical protein [Amycolatopsis sp. lyj-23]|uniref:hypothetical protein n=1 Tax=Amycolatopsis sp. lyj-23 TaxID=2789283 RepID=UPI00397BA614
MSTDSLGLAGPPAPAEVAFAAGQGLSVFRKRMAELPVSGPAVSDTGHSPTELRQAPACRLRLAKSFALAVVGFAAGGRRSDCRVCAAEPSAPAVVGFVAGGGRLPCQLCVVELSAPAFVAEDERSDCRARVAEPVVSAAAALRATCAPSAVVVSSGAGGFVSTDQLRRIRGHWLQVTATKALAVAGSRQPACRVCAAEASVVAFVAVGRRLPGQMRVVELSVPALVGFVAVGGRLPCRMRVPELSVVAFVVEDGRSACRGRVAEPVVSAAISSSAAYRRARMSSLRERVAA